MNRQKQTRKPSSEPSLLPLYIVGIVCFALGAGSTWIIMRESRSVSPAASTSAAARPNVPAAVPPDVSNLPPADAARTLANWNYDQQNWTHAIDHYQEAIKRGADNPDIHTDLGNCFRFLGQTSQAIEQYQIARRQNPLHENSLLNLAGLLQESSADREKAAAAWREYLSRFPTGTGTAQARAFLSQIPPTFTPGKLENNAALKGLINEDAPKPPP